MFIEKSVWFMFRNITFELSSDYHAMSKEFQSFISKQMVENGISDSNISKCLMKLLIIVVLSHPDTPSMHLCCVMYFRS